MTNLSSEKLTFLDALHLEAIGPRLFARSIERLLLHLSFEDVRNIDGPGDEGGDILASRGGYRWVFQCKWKKSGLVTDQAVREVDAAKAFYSADRAVVVTNRAPGPKAMQHQMALLGVGVRIDFWSDQALAKFASEVIPERAPQRFGLRPYQEEAVAAAASSLDQHKRALVILATGLGKTVIAGGIVEWQLGRDVRSDILVVAHVKELVQQLERAMWRHVPKQVLTQTLTGEAEPPSLAGVTCATVQSAITAIEAGWRPQLVIVDEAHHVGEQGYFDRLLSLLEGVPVLGLTATPWRGDGYDLSLRFGEPVFRMGIAEGMAAGFLAEVDYRLFVDNLDWTAVSSASEVGLTVRELNRRLFLPQRDEAIIERLQESWQTTLNPRAIVYCRTINHAEEIAQILRASGWRRAACISTRQTRRERDLLMSEFRDGRVPIVTTVDIFNEGVDVPDVNILCFMRVTHSRRIFIQQLGRGLRLSPSKERVQVLDFVSDVRRVAATLELQRALDRLREEDIERVTLPVPIVTFDEPQIGTLLQEWILDAAALEDADDEVRLQFPAMPVP